MADTSKKVVLGMFFSPSSLVQTRFTEKDLVCLNYTIQNHTFWAPPRGLDSDFRRNTIPCISETLKPPIGQYYTSSEDPAAYAKGSDPISTRRP